MTDTWHRYEVHYLGWGDGSLVDYSDTLIGARAIAMSNTRFNGTLRRPLTIREVYSTQLDDKRSMRVEIDLEVLD